MKSLLIFVLKVILKKSVIAEIYKKKTHLGNSNKNQIISIPKHQSNASHD